MMNAQSESPWWGDPSLDWTRGDLGVLLDLLATAYPDWVAITEITQAARLDFQPESDATAEATSIWTRILRKAANERRLLALMAKVLDDQSGKKSYLRIARLLDSLIAPPTDPGQEASGGLESIASGEAGPIEAGAYIQAQFDLTWRTAAIMVDGLICGAGCLVREDLLLTAAHVVGAGEPPSARPRAIMAVFDFIHRPGVSRADTGIRVPVTRIICDSPPTDAEKEERKGEDWEASPDKLDFALLQLEGDAPVAALHGGVVRPRGHYRLDLEPYVFRRGIALTIAHYPLQDFLNFSPVFGVPRRNHSGTRIRYNCNTLIGSSGGPVVDMHGNLVALHHYSSGRENQGVPVSAIMRNLKDNNLDDLLDAPERTTVSHLGEYSVNAKQKICQGIEDDWRPVWRELGAPAYVSNANDLWDWLSARRKLYKLRGALEILGCSELTKILDNDLAVVDEVRVADINDQACDLLESIRPVQRARSPEDLLASILDVRILAEKMLTEIGSLPELQNHPRLQLKWRMNWSDEFERAETALEDLSRTLPASSVEARQALDDVDSMIEYADEAKSAIASLYRLARRPVLSL